MGVEVKVGKIGHVNTCTFTFLLKQDLTQPHLAQRNEMSIQ